MLSCGGKWARVHVVNRVTPSVKPLDPMHCNMSTEVIEIEAQEEEEVLPAELEEGWGQFREFGIRDPDDLDDGHGIDPQDLVEELQSQGLLDQGPSDFSILLNLRF